MTVFGRLSQKVMSMLVKNFLLILVYTYSPTVYLLAFVRMKDCNSPRNGHRLIKVNIFYIASGSPVSDLPVREGEDLESFMG